MYLVSLIWKFKLWVTQLMFNVDFKKIFSMCNSLFKSNLTWKPKHKQIKAELF